MAAIPNYIYVPLSCENQGFSSIAEYVQCTDMLRDARGGAPPVPPKPEEVYLLNIDFHDQSTIIAIITILVLSIHPLSLIAKQWKSLVPRAPFIGICAAIVILLPNVTALFYIATNVDYNYLKAHYDHLGHPPLYGDVPPLTPILYGWLCTSCFELIMVVAFMDNKTHPQLLYVYLNVIDAYLSVFYWQNLTCLGRILTGLITRIIAILVCPIDNSTAKVYINSGYYIFNIVHMLMYIWRGVTNHNNPSEVTTTSWFVVPSEYQRFAIYQVCMLLLQWIVTFIIYYNQIKQQKKPTIQNETETIINNENSKQD